MGIGRATTVAVFAILTTAILLTTALAMFESDATNEAVDNDEPYFINVSTEEGYKNVYPSTANWIVTDTSATLELNGVNVQWIIVDSDRELTIKLNGENFVDSNVELIAMNIKCDNVTVTGKSLTISIPNGDNYGFAIMQKHTGSKCTIDDAEITVKCDETSAAEKDTLGILSLLEMEIKNSTLYFINIKCAVSVGGLSIPITIADSYISLNNPLLEEFSIETAYYFVSCIDVAHIDTKPVCDDDKGEIKYCDYMGQEVRWEDDFSMVLTSSSAHIGKEPEPVPTYDKEIKSGENFSLTIPTTKGIKEVYLYKDGEKGDALDEGQYQIEKADDETEITFSSDLTKDAGNYKFEILMDGGVTVSGDFTVTQADPVPSSNDNSLVIGIVFGLLFTLTMLMFAFVIMRS